MEGKESKLSFKKTDKHAASEHNGGAAAADDKALSAEQASEPQESAEDTASGNDVSGNADKETEEFSDDDFVKCTCGRIIPRSRASCAYCGAINKDFVPQRPFDDKKQKENK